VDAWAWHYRCPVRNARCVPRWVGRVLGSTVLVSVGAAALAGCGNTAADGATPAPAARSSAARSSAEPTSTASPLSGPRTPSPSETLLPTAAPPYSSAGALVAGFPAGLLPVPDGAEILVSSAVPIGANGVEDISLNLHSPATAAALMGIYRAALLAAGFQEVAPAAVQAGLAEESTFTRSSGDEILVVGILDQNAVRTVTIGGRVRVPK
jgi:hypothetical protein